MLKHRLESGALHPYAINDVEFRYADTTIIHNFLFDITDEKNKEALKEFEKHSEKKQKELRDSAFFKACEENQVVALEKTANLQGTGLYTFGDIERFGYGTKADLIAHCDLLIDAYETRKRLYDRDIINSSDPTIQAVMKLSKEKNPAIVQLSKLEELIGEDFRQMVIDGKFSIITSTLFERIPRNKYIINLNDPKNIQTLKSIDNKELQEWLKQKEEEIKIYREKNEAIVEEFKRSKAPTKEEAIKAYEAKKFQREIRTVIEADNERIAKKRKAWENKRNLSLRTTIAWVLSPNTREIQKEKANPTIKEILDRNTQIREIHSLVLAGEMTTLEAKERIRELKLSQEEEIAILGFYKGAWEMAGTEEWINALKQAKEIAKLYLKGGLEAIADDKIKNRLELWEKKWGKN